MNDKNGNLYVAKDKLLVADMIQLISLRLKNMGEKDREWSGYTPLQRHEEIERAGEYLDEALTNFIRLAVDHGLMEKERQGK